MALEYGAEAPFLRPAKFAGDLEPDLSTFVHALGHLKDSEGYEPDVVVHLRATCPLRGPHDIDKAISLLLSRPDSDAVRSVSEVKSQSVANVDDG